MTTNNNGYKRFPRSHTGIALAVALAAPAAQGLDFNYAGINGSWDNSVRVGVGVRASDQNKDFISQGNLGPEFAFSDTGASSNNTDNGNLNFEKGDPYSQFAQINSELFLDYRARGQYLSRAGAKIVGRYTYDYELRQNERATDPVGQQRVLNDEARDNAAEAELLDAYVFTDWWVGNVPVAVRYGNQVVNWGESTFILGGINQTNPIDVRAFRKPGAEVKDVLLPTEMLYTSIGLTTNLTIEAYYQTDWDSYKIDDCGTFFSTADVAADGCGPVLLAGQVPDSQALADGLFAPREGDREPRDGGQYGISARYFVPDWDMELGAYYLSFHSRLPYLSGRVNNPEAGNTTDNVDFNPNLESSRFPSYFVEYPEDQELLGLSMNTTLPTGTSLGAEYSFQPDRPVQRNTTDLIFGGLQQRGPNGEILSKVEQDRREANPDKNFAGQVVNGFDRFDISQVQATFIHFFDRVMGTDRFIIVSEIGGTYVHDLPDTSEAVYGRNATFGSGPLPVEGENFTGDFCREGPDGGPGANINSSYCLDDGFTTDFSWGYRALFAWDYSSFYMGWNLMPSIYFAHDVEGYAPDPAGNFQEGSKQLGLTLTADYQNRWKAELSYTEFFDGQPFNEMSDRDHIAAALSYSF